MSNIDRYNDFTIFGRLVDGRLTTEELEQVETRLMNDAEFRRSYIQFMDLDFELGQRIGNKSSIDNLDVHRNPVLLTETPTTVSPYRRTAYVNPSNSFGRFFLKFAAVLVMALIGGWIYTIYDSSREDLSKSLPVRALVWSVEDAGSNWETGMVLEEGEYHLPQGSVELKFAYDSRGNSALGFEEPFPTAVRLTVEGPARFVLRSRDCVKLISGKLAAEVFPEAKGFTVLANDVEVVDLGTRFAVTADSNDTAVHVYDGIVKAKVDSLGNKPNALLETGSTVRLNPNSGELDEIPFQQELFTPPPKWSGSLEEASSVVRVFDDPLRSARRNLKESAKESFIFCERDELILESDVIVNLSKPKRVEARAVTQGEFITKIPKGTKVATYFANFALEDGAKNGVVTFNFDSPILGIIYHHELVLDTDLMLGAPQTNYRLNEKPRKAGEAALTGLDGHSWVEIHEDSRSVSIGFVRPVGNQIRILVAKD